MAKPTDHELKVTIPLEERWERGIEHDPRSSEIYHFIAAYDFKHNGDSLELSSGGDGDNGETLMYLLDEFFAVKDTESARSVKSIESAR